MVDAADLVGSTEFIIKTIAEAPAGSTWAIGTELHLVNRLKAENPDKTIHFLSPMVCMCATMYRIDLPHLAWSLENLARGTPGEPHQGPGRDRALGAGRAAADAGSALIRRRQANAVGDRPRIVSFLGAR